MAKSWGITDSLRADHGELRRLMAYMASEASVARKREIFAREFLPLLESHTAAEEETLIARALADERLRARGTVSLEQHDVTEFAAAKIKSAATDEQWVARLKVITGLLGHHLDDEERDFFPLAEAALSADERSELATRYSETRERHRLAPVIQLPLRAFAAEEKTGS